MRFANTWVLSLLILLPLLYWYYNKYYRSASIKYSSLYLWKELLKSQQLPPRMILFLLKLTAVVLIILALARPQAGIKTEEITTRGVDIILCLDTSTSMRALDFKPLNRLDAAKQAAKEFVKGRKHDRIGIVVFSALAFTQCPLTVDYGAIVDFIDKVEIGMTQMDGTAVGTAIVTALNRLKDSQAKSKIIILLTDGRSNMGEIDPLTAAKAAQALDVKIYTIGCGARGGSLYPVDHPVFGRQYVTIQEDLDENTLSQIAELTSGSYFRATTAKKLVEVYKQIDKLEKTEIKVQEYTEYRELFTYFLLPALILLLSAIVTGNTVLSKIP
ncbi:MAG: VWA domain-containing protein [Elusimicrobiota bacterium]